MESVIHSLENYAGLQPDALVYAFLDGAGEVADSYTYRRFHTRSNYMADVLRRTGAIRYGEPALLVYPPGLEFIVAFFLAGTEPTLPLYIWNQLRFPKSLPTVMALGTVILVVSIVIASFAEFLRHRGLSTAARPARLDPSQPKETARGELQWHST